MTVLGLGRIDTGTSGRGRYVLLWGALVLGVLLLGMSRPAQAQPLRGGVRLGPTFGFLNDSVVPFVSRAGRTEARTNVRIDVHAGAHLIVPLAEHWSFQPEMLFVRKGGHLSRSGLGLYAAEQYRLTYLQAHLLGRRDVTLPGPLSMHLVAGATGAVVTGALVKRDVRTPTRSTGEHIRLLRQNLVRRWDVGGLVGAGLGYPVGRGTIALELRYNPGIRTLFTEHERPPAQQPRYGDEPPPLTRTPPPLRHDTLLVSLVYTVPLGP